MNRSTLTGLAAALLLLAGSLSLFAMARDEPAPEQLATSAEQILQLGVLFDYTGRLGVHGPDLEEGVQLAVEQVNSAGGVFGQPVAVVLGDGETNSDIAVARAREMVRGGVDVLVGPMGSQAALRVGIEVSGPLGVPTITPSATSPELSLIDDDGFLFRTALSDVAQGPVLASLARDDGMERVSVVYQDDAYGRGLYQAFEASFDGHIHAAVTVPPEADSYLPELRQAAGGGSQALLVVAYPGATDILVEEALDHGFFDRFLFVDANFGPDVVLAVGAERLEGQKGTIPIGAGNSLPGYSTVLAELRERSQRPLKQSALAAYDAAVCLCLAAERAGTTDGDAIRNALYEVCGEGGQRIDAGADGVARALASLRDGRDIDFDGATSTIDWDPSGDVTRGSVGVYRFEGGTVVLVDRVAFGPAADEDSQPTT